MEHFRFFKFCGRRGGRYGRHGGRYGRRGSRYSRAANYISHGVVTMYGIWSKELLDVKQNLDVNNFFDVKKK